MTEKSFSDRLTVLRIERRLSGRAFAKAAGLKPSTYQALTTGRSPTLDTLVIIANSLGVNVGWLATGEGPKYPEMPEGSAEAPKKMEVPRAPTLDWELFGRVVDRVASVYREEGVRISNIDLGRLAAERYEEMAGFVGDPEEWPAFLDVIGSRVRKTIRAAATDPTNVKREA